VYPAVKTYPTADGQDEVDGTSTIYQIGSDYLNCNDVPTLIKVPCSDLVYARKLLNGHKNFWKRQKKEKTNTTDPLEQAVRRNLQDLFLIREETQPYFDDLQRKIQSYADSGKSAYLKRTEGKKLASQYATSEKAVEALALRNKSSRFVSRDEFGRRLHTNLTSIKSELRQYLHFKDCSEPLYLIDMSCTQPLLLNLVIKNYLQEKWETGELTMPQYEAELAKRNLKDVKKYLDVTQDGSFFKTIFKMTLQYYQNSFTKLVSGYYDFEGHQHRSVVKPEDLKTEFKKVAKDLYDFIDFFEVGSISEEQRSTLRGIYQGKIDSKDIPLEFIGGFIGVMGIMFDPPMTPEVKKTLKRSVCFILFSKPYKNRHFLVFVERAFKYFYPTIWDVIQLVKKEYYKDLPMQIQRLESSVFIDDALFKLIVNENKRFVMSIHDCLMCQQSEVGTVVTRIQEALGKHQLKAVLKVENLSDGSVYPIPI
jgi:hypothetical protein